MKFYQTNKKLRETNAATPNKKGRTRPLWIGTTEQA
jgi:hypothetical protein